LRRWPSILLVSPETGAEAMVTYSRELAYAPNISWLLTDHAFEERPGLVARAGFGAIEFGFPSHADVSALERAREEWGLDIVAFNQDVPVWDERNRGYLVDPARRDEFRRTLEEALDLARRLQAKKVMLPAGVELPGVDRRAQDDCMVENLNEAAILAEDAGVLLTIEVLNPIDNPGYYLTSLQQAIAILEQVDHPNVRLQFDSYHMQMLEGPAEQAFRRAAPWVGHVQFGDCPGRCRPGKGTIDYDRLLDAVCLSGYRGYIGLEYKPELGGVDELDWVPNEMRRLGVARNTTISETAEKGR